MPNNGFTLEKSLKVYDDNNGYYIEIKQNPDFPLGGIVITTTTSKGNSDWYGVANISINSKEQAKLLAQAILEMADQITE